MYPQNPTWVGNHILPYDKVLMSPTGWYLFSVVADLRAHDARVGPLSTDGPRQLDPPMLAAN